MSERISSEVFVSVIQECFDRGQEIEFLPTGTSMLPMLDGENDKVTLAAPPERLRKYDVAFYKRRRTGQVVLHRMVGFTRDGGYIFSGDNQYYYEYGVGNDDILALMTAFTRKGKRYDTGKLSYRFYIHRMMQKKRLRMLALKVYRRIRRK